MAIGNMFYLKHLQSFNGEDIENIYTYECDEGMHATDLVNAFISDVLPAVLTIQGDIFLTHAVSAYSMGNTTDWIVTEHEAAGAYVGADTLPAFNAVGYTLRSANRAIRPGSKRYAGIPESVQIRGQISDAGYLAQMESLRVALDTAISDDDTLFATPVVVKRVKYAVPGSDPVRYAYRYPTTDEELVFAGLVGVFTSPHVTHQVSRGNS